MEPIKNEIEYHEIMAGIDFLMSKGSDIVSNEALDLLSQMAGVAQQYEKEYHLNDLE